MTAAAAAANGRGVKGRVGKFRQSNGLWLEGVDVGQQVGPIAQIQRIERWPTRIRAVDIVALQNAYRHPGEIVGCQLQRQRLLGW